MPVIKHLEPPTAARDILEAAGLIKQPAGNSKKEKLLNILEERGVGVERLATEIESQLYSSDETVKDKAIDRLLKINDIVTPNADNTNAPSITFVLQVGENKNLLQILSPRI